MWPSFIPSYLSYRAHLHGRIRLRDVRNLFSSGIATTNLYDCFSCQFRASGLFSEPARRCNPRPFRSLSAQLSDIVPRNRCARLQHGGLSPAMANDLPFRGSDHAPMSTLLDLNATPSHR